MKILKIVLIVLMATSIVGFIGFFWLMSKVGEGMSNNEYHFSKGIVESKKNNLFLATFKPLKDSMVLGGRSYQISALNGKIFNDSLRLESVKIKSQKMWFEKKWNMDSNKINIFSGTNIVLPDTSLLTRKVKVYVFYKEPKSKDCFSMMDEKDGLGYTAFIDSIPDTVTLLFRTNYPDAGYVDTIEYVRE